MLACTLAFALLGAAFIAPSNTLHVSVDDAKTATLTINVGGEAWLMSHGLALHSAGQWLHPFDGSLSLVNSSNINGTDSLGPFSGTALVFAQKTASVDSASPATITARIKYYSHLEAYVFEQQFDNRLANVSFGNADQPASMFPAIDVSKLKAASLKFLTQRHIFGGVTSGTGLSGFPGDIQSGTPLVIFDDSAIINGTDTEVLVFSPLNSFKVAVQALSGGPMNGTLGMGLNGMLEEVPEGYTYSTILASGQSIHAALRHWGDILMKAGGKEPNFDVEDVTTAELSYWLDNGAFYYYFTDDFENYQDTVINIFKYHEKAGLPAQSYQMDSWWYTKYLFFDGGLELWEPKKILLPDGFEYVYNVTKKKMTFHNRWFSSHNDYMDKFKFATQLEAALPVGTVDEVADLYGYLMRFHKEWGMAVYEQDWLTNQYKMMDITRKNISAAWNWLAGMHQAAQQRDILIQYCMPLPSDFLMSTQLQNVRQIRVSNDYASDQFGQWKIGKTSMMAWAVGLKPFKDVFRTSFRQLPNVYIHNEPNPSLQALVATLSTGPVGFGDKINATNTTIVLGTCMSNGTILSPSRPASSIEATYTSAAPSGEVWSTESEVEISASSLEDGGGSVPYYYVFGAALSSAFDVFPRHLRMAPSPGQSSSQQYVAFSWGLDIQVPTFANFSDSAPINVPACPQDDKTHKAPYHFYTVAPVLVDADADASSSNTAVFVGEQGKFVPVSPKRTLSVSYKKDTLTVKLRGAPNESSTFVAHLSSADKGFVTATCQFGQDGRATFVATSKGASC